VKWYTHNKTVPTTQASARYLFLGTAIETVGIVGGFVDAHQIGTDAIDDKVALCCVRSPSSTMGCLRLVDSLK